MLTDLSITLPSCRVSLDPSMFAPTAFAKACRLSLGPTAWAEAKADSSPVTDNPHVHADVVLLRRTRQCEWVILEITDFRTVDEDVLPGARARVFLLDLHFEHFGRVQYDLGYVRDVTSCFSAITASVGQRALTSDFTQHTFGDPDDAAWQPVFLPIS